MRHFAGGDLLESRTGMKNNNGNYLFQRSASASAGSLAQVHWNDHNTGSSSDGPYVTETGRTLAGLLKMIQPFAH